MLISKNKINYLFSIHAEPCISLFIPTHRSGFDNSKADRLRFKNLLSQTRQSLSQHGYSENESNKLLQPAYDLYNEESFWSNLSDGLAMFISPDHSEYFELPIAFNTYHFVGDHYHLRSLLPMFNGDGRFFLLALSQNEVRFFEGSRNSITPVEIEDLMPENIEAELQLEENEKNLQFHGGGNRQSGPIYHGHGSGDDDKNANLEKYFRYIDKGLMRMLYDEEVPMIISAVDYLVPIYRSISQYEPIVDFHISGNPEHLSPIQLHEKAWQQMSPFFRREEEKDRKKFTKYALSNRSSIHKKDIVPAAANGKIETLFVNKNLSGHWGEFQAMQNRTELHPNRKAHSMCLLEFAAMNTFMQGGRVYNVPAAQMPDPNTAMNANFRF